MKKTAIIFPSKAMPLDAQVEVKSPEPLGLTAPFVVKHKALDLPLYDQPIKCAIEGRDKEGKQIEVNSVGRWLFGVPGYEGRSRIAAKGSSILIYYPKKSPKVVDELLQSLKEAVESGK